MKAVSVIVPCYNAAKYLDKCIGQLVRQTIGIENIEIILVNDASTDDGATWRVITEYEQIYPDTIIAVDLEQNLRQGGARNVGVSYASGEYLVFCDADDWMLEEALEHSYCAAKENDADVVGFLGTNLTDRDALVVLEKGDRSELVVLNNDEVRKAFILEVTEKFSYGSQTKLYRLSMLRDYQIAFIEHRIFEEPTFTVLVRLYAARYYFLDERLYVWYLSPGSTMRSDWGEHKWDNPKVWMYLVNDLAQRGFLEKFSQELEYLFFGWGYGLSIRMALQRGYVLTKEELTFLIDMTLRIFPNIRKNQYIRSSKVIWESLLLTLLDMEITEESAQVINEVLRKHI